MQLDCLCRVAVSKIFKPTFYYLPLNFESIIEFLFYNTGCIKVIKSMYEQLLCCFLESKYMQFHLQPLDATVDQPQLCYHPFSSLYG